MFIFSRERRVTIIMGTITLAFLICIWPYGVIFMMGVLQQKKEILQKGCHAHVPQQSHQPSTLHLHQQAGQEGPGEAVHLSEAG